MVPFPIFILSIVLCLVSVLMTFFHCFRAIASLKNRRLICFHLACASIYVIYARLLTSLPILNCEITW